MSPPLASTVTVRRVRRAGPAGGAGRSARHRVLDALDRLDPETGLPTSAILAVRRLRGTVAGDPPRVVELDLVAVAARARPARAGPPPADCDAVVFADEVDLVVCLARDVDAGRPLGWWWATVLGRGAAGALAGGGVPDGGALPAAVAVAVAFRAHARALPAACAAAPRPVEAAAGLLAPIEVVRLLGLVGEAHGAPSLEEVVRRALTGGLGPAAAEGPAVAPLPHRDDPVGPGPARTGPSGGPPPDPGVASWGLPDGPGSAQASPAALLVAVAAGLHRDPVATRRPQVAAAVARTLAGWRSPGTGGPRRPDGTGGPGGAHARSAPGRAGMAPGEPGSGAAPERPRPDGAPGLESRADPTPRAHALSVPEGAEPDPGPRRVRTALGGAFYLLPLLEELDLPASAGGPGQPGAGVSRWHVLALVLRGWEVDAADPLPDLLDELGGPRGAAEAGAAEALAWGGPGALASWGAAVGRQVEALLARFELDRRIVSLPAKIEVGPTVVRLWAGLDDIDLGVRRAGLDRDPGWVPALGRTVELVFS